MITELKAAMLTARKARDTVKVTSYALMISEIENIGKNDGNRETTTDEAVALIKKMVTRNEELSGYTPAGPARDKIDAETAMMRQYLPQMVGIEEVSEFVGQVVADGASNIGQVMFKLKQEYGQSVDMKTAGGIVRAALADI